MRSARARAHAELLLVADGAHDACRSQGRELVVSLRRYPNMDALLEHLSSVVKHGAVRKIVTPSGHHRVSKVGAFKDGRVRWRSVLARGGGLRVATGWLRCCCLLERQVDGCHAFALLGDSRGLF